VALGADDVQPAGGHHLVVQLLPGLADLGDAPLLLGALERLVRLEPLDLGLGLPPSTMSVPRPAMLVAIVIILGRPAWITISASRACCLALSTWCGSPSFCSIDEMSSEFSMEVVPSSTGWPRSCRPSPR